jgi:hypothetical protein
MIRKKLTYEERVRWFYENHYETGMEYQNLLNWFKGKNLDSFQWYDNTVSIPKYKTEKDELVIKCADNCSAISLDKFEDDETFFITFYRSFDRNKGVWFKLKTIWKILFGGIIHDTELILTKEDIVKIEDWCYRNTQYIPPDFRCQRYYEDESPCVNQCEHCEKYYKPLDIKN